MVLVLTFFAGMAYWQLSPFYPSFLHKKGIDRMYVGVMLSVYAFCFLTSAYATGTYLLQHMTRLHGCFLGGILIVINQLGIGTLDFADSKNYILIMSCLLQIIGGVGNGINIASTMALLSSHKDHRDEYIGYFELISGLSALIGPLLGSMFFWCFGFIGPYFTIGTAYLLAIIIFSFRKDRLEAKLRTIMR